MATGPDAVSTEEERAARAFAYENARPEVLAMVPAGRHRVLDLGCSSGAFGAALKARDGCTVVGVEFDAAYADVARERLDEVHVADLQQLADDDALEDRLGRFDAVVAADVLEHLTDPWTVLAAMARLVDSGDPVVVSLPNVRFWETFWAIGRHGTFPRASSGIFDRTHLRWFTLADAIGLLEGAGLAHEATHRQMRLGRHYHAEWDRRVRVLERTPLRPFFTYQNIVRGRRR